MNIRITKGERRVSLVKRELDMLTNAKQLLAELAVVGGGDIATEADVAADKIGEALQAIERQGQAVAAPY